MPLLILKKNLSDHSQLAVRISEKQLVLDKEILLNLLRI